MGNAHGFQGRLLPYANKPTVQEIPEFSHPGSIIPVKSSTIWPVLCSHGIHKSSDINQIDCSKQGYKNPPIPRQLIRAKSHQTYLIHTP